MAWVGWDWLMAMIVAFLIAVGHGHAVETLVNGQGLQTAALKARAQLYLLDFDYDGALDSLNAALAASPDNPALYVARGQVYLLLYEWDQVMADYNAALALDPDYADAYYYRGLLYYTTLVDRVNALPDFERYLALAPDGPHAIRALNYADAIRAELDALSH